MPSGVIRAKLWNASAYKPMLCVSNRALSRHLLPGRIFGVTMPRRRWLLGFSIVQNFPTIFLLRDADFNGGQVVISRSAAGTKLKRCQGRGVDYNRPFVTLWVQRAAMVLLIAPSLPAEFTAQ